MDLLQSFLQWLLKLTFQSIFKKFLLEKETRVFCFVCTVSYLRKTNTQEKRKRRSRVS